MKKSRLFFKYPPNLNTLDLANIISMYRSRGEPADAAAGDFFGCAATHKLLKKAKTWFGLHYSQQAWDALLTKDSQGYPLTEVEFNILGLAHLPPKPDFTRAQVESNCGTLAQLAFIIVSDLKQFEFLEEDEDTILSLTAAGEKALQGISQRIFEKRFTSEFLLINRDTTPAITRAKKQENIQTDLF